MHTRGYPVMIEEKQIDESIVRLPKPYFDELSSLDLLDREDLLSMVKKMVSGGVVLSFHGKRTAQEIDKKVRPRQTRIVSGLCVGAPEEQARNFIYEGENLQARLCTMIRRQVRDGVSPLRAPSITCA
jgi:hypothetical protein